MTTIGKVTFAVLLGALGCGGVQTSDVQSARTQATAASCNYFMMCHDIGPDAGTSGYDSYQDCTAQVLGQWTNGWPTSTCQGHIDQHALTVCVDAINSTTDCNGLAELITLSKCTSALVCGSGVPADGGAD